MNVAAVIIHVKMGADVKHYPLDTSVTADQDSLVIYPILSKQMFTLYNFYLLLKQEKTVTSTLMTVLINPVADMADVKMGQITTPVIVTWALWVPTASTI